MSFKPFLLIALCMLQGCSAHGENGAKIATFQCGSGLQFTIRYEDNFVIVTTAAHTLRMLPNPFHIGSRYTSDAGTLIIDDDFASLILKDDLRHSDCRMVKMGNTTPSEQKRLIPRKG